VYDRRDVFLGVIPIHVYEEFLPSRDRREFQLGKFCSSISRYSFNKAQSLKNSWRPQYTPSHQKIPFFDLGLLFNMPIHNSILACSVIKQLHAGYITVHAPHLFNNAIPKRLHHIDGFRNQYLCPHPWRFYHELSRPRSCIPMSRDLAFSYAQLQTVRHGPPL